MTKVVQKMKNKKTSGKIKKLPSRDRVRLSDCWDLSSLFPNDAAWEKAFGRWQKLLPDYAQFRGTLSRSGTAVAACLEFNSRIERTAEKLEYYAFLKTAEDSTNSTYQGMIERYRNAAREAGEIASYIRPELLAIPAVKIKKIFRSSAVRPWRLALERILRYKPHTLSQREERLDVLDARLEEMNLDKADYWWYRDLRKYGTVPHAGFGLGFERTLIYATGMANVRDVIPFPRTPRSAAF